MRLKSLASLVLVAASAACTADPIATGVESSMVTATAASAKVAVCHVNGAGAFSMNTVAPSALAAHIAHGDAVPGAAVPGQAGKKFTDACEIVNAGPDFFTFYIRNNNGIPLPARISAPWDDNITLLENPAGDGFSFGTAQGGQKVGYGTSFFDGIKVNTLESTNWAPLGGMIGGIIPYLNIWVTDGAGHYAVISSENQYPGTIFTTRTEWKVFEFFSAAPCDVGLCPALNWLFDDGSQAGRTNQYLTDDGNNAALGALGDNIIIMSPPSYDLPGIGSGAPRGGYGFNRLWQHSTQRGIV